MRAWEHIRDEAVVHRILRDHPLPFRVAGTPSSDPEYSPVIDTVLQ
jgi:hypothetical protein